MKGGLRVLTDLDPQNRSVIQSLGHGRVQPTSVHVDGEGDSLRYSHSWSARSSILASIPGAQRILRDVPLPMLGVSRSS